MNTNLTINTTKIRENKNAILATSLILLFAVSIALDFAPTGSAQIPFSAPRKTAGYISVAPTLIGVGQSATVNLWVLPPPQDYATAAWYNGFTGITVTFTKPDGNKDTFTPTDGTGTYPAGVTDPLGSMYFLYAPNMAGNWSVTMTMPAQNFTDWSGTVQWTACTSAPVYFTVQTAPVNAGLLNGWPYSQLPTGYWSYPINSNNREWYQISGDWLTASVPPTFYPMILNTGGFWQQYGSGPSTGHILWDIQNTAGGIVGGSFGSYSIEPGNLISGNPIIMGGKVYQNILPDSLTAAPTQFECIDLTTGKVLYTASGSITAGLHLPGNAYYQSSAAGLVQLHASYGNTPTEYLFQTVGSPMNGTWNYYDPNTGTLALSISNVTAMNIALVDGSEIAFGTTYTGYQNYVWEWNLTTAVNNGKNWYNGLVWKTFLSHPAPSDGSGRTSLAVSKDLSAIVYGGGPGDDLVEGFNAKTGASIWNLTLPYTSTMGQIQLYNTTDFLTCDVSTATFYCYSDLTGALVWSSANVGAFPWNTKYSGYFLANDNSNVYIASPDGSVIALSLADGKVVWQSTKIPSTEYMSNYLPFEFGGLVIAGGTVYAYGGYSQDYEIDPIPRFAMTIAINATTGKTMFTLNGGVSPNAAADGYLLAFGNYDGKQYCIGKGATSTSVSVPNNFALKSTVQIQGNVLDQSPAQPGTPAVSDSSMSEWMDYLHMQNATLLNSPPQEIGVPVTLTAVDPNNNTVIIGTTTTDSAGNFYYSWTPQISGSYRITASFAGTGSYWSSSAETGTVVTETATTAPTATPLSETAIESTIIPYVIIATIVIVLAIAIATMLILRKRP
ncbi:MAG: PQQ-binding-like beta-propeller repeat protein [Candidatus Bathyarchaeia archaeon]